MIVRMTVKAPCLIDAIGYYMGQVVTREFHPYMEALAHEGRIEFEETEGEDLESLITDKPKAKRK